MSTPVVCPRCAATITVEAWEDGGDWVPYGSTNVRLPSAWIVEPTGPCPNCGLSVDEMVENPDYCASIERQYWEAQPPEPDDWPDPPDEEEAL